MMIILRGRGLKIEEGTRQIRQGGDAFYHPTHKVTENLNQVQN
jgi:hypothetical protein